MFPAPQPHRRLTLRQLAGEVINPYRDGGLFPRLSAAVDGFFLLCILAACAVIFLDHRHPEHRPLLRSLELGLTALFAAEYLLRWYAAPNRWRHPFTFFALVDLLAIVPSVLLLSADGLMLRSVRVVRLLSWLRVVRFARLLRFLGRGYVIYRGVVQARVWLSAVSYRYHLQRIGRLCMWLLLAWVVGANVVHATETSLGGGAGPFADYWKTYWNILIVLISGIEDKEPVSLLGRVEITLMLLAGIVVVGMLTGEIVAILMRRMQRAGKVAVLPPTSRMAHHVLVLGSNDHLDRVVQELVLALQGRSFVVLVHPDAEERRVPEGQSFDKVFALSGDPLAATTLQRVEVDHALRVVVLAAESTAEEAERTDHQTLMTALAVVSRKRHVPVVAQLHREETLCCAAQLGDVEFVIPRHYEEKLISQAVLSPGITAIFDELMTFAPGTAEFYLVPAPGALVGQSFTAAQLRFLDDDDGEPVVLVGLARREAERWRTVVFFGPQALLPEDLRVIGDEDQLVVIASQRPSFAAIDQEALWSGKEISRA